MKVAILTDSNTGLFAEDEKKYNGLYIMSMPFMIDGENYYEGINLTHQQFYEKLKGDAEIFTSMPAIGEVVDKWEELLKGYDQVVYIPMSSSLSMSCQTAINFARDYEGKVFVADNQRISVTQRQSVFDALKMAQEGKNGQEIKDYLESTKKDSSIYIMVDTLKYLKKGGRITPAAAMIGTLLKLKPVLQIQGGKLDNYAKTLNERVARQKMIDAMKKDLETRFAQYVSDKSMKLYVAYTNCLDKAKDFAEQIKKEIPDLEISAIDSLSLQIACHIGDGAIAIACAREYRG